MTSPATQKLFDNLAKAGLRSDYVRRLLPEWVNEASLDDTTILPELKLAIARRFGLDVRALMDEASEVRWQMPLSARFKRSKRVKERDLDVATAIAVAAARMATAGLAVPYRPPPPSGLAVRAQIAERYKPKFVSLGVIVRHSWDSGIPVLFIGDLPEGVPKMDALAVSHRGRPTIVVSKSVRYAAWLSFIIAHELGHIARGHLGADDLVVDSEISDDSYLLADDDIEEREADAFAIELLNGAAERRYVSDRPFNANELATAAMDVQRASGIDAGHVILNYGHSVQRWDVAVAALGLLDKDDARSFLHAAAHERIAPEELPPDSLKFLLRIAG